MMGFTPQPDVLRITSYSKNYKFIGHGPWRSRFYIKGRNYSFGNPLSAAMFSYLAKKKIADKDASAAVIAFESKLYERKLELNLYEKIAAHAKDKVLGKIKDKIPYYGYIEKGAKVMAAVGAYVDEERVRQKHKNPYEPDASTRISFSGLTSKAEQYADYAISYWGANPHEGPMYMLQRDSF